MNLSFSRPGRPRARLTHLARTLAYLTGVLGTMSALNTHAHVTAKPDEGAAGSWFETALKVSHGCDGSPTTSLRVTIPDGVLSVKPQMKPGWTVNVTYRPIDPPLKGEHGAVISQTVATVEWRGNQLPDNLYDTFGLVMKLPAAAGKHLDFPAVQTCESGERAWVEIPAEGQSRHALHSPAPFVQLNQPTK